MFDFKKDRAWAENLHLVMQAGLTMAGCIAFCFYVGLKLDRWLGTRGLFLTVFTLLGVVGGAVTVYRQIMASLPKPSEGQSNDRPEQSGDRGGDGRD